MSTQSENGFKPFDRIYQNIKEKIDEKPNKYAKNTIPMTENMIFGYISSL